VTGDPKPTAVRRITDVPLNAEAPLAALVEPIQRAGTFYVRSNFPTPAAETLPERLHVVGLDGATRAIPLHELLASPALTRTVTLECAGNGRTLLTPLPPGTAWTLGGTGTATFTGVPLRSLLPDLGDAVEVVFTAADRGAAEGWGEIPFQRALPVEAIDEAPEPLVAWRMNGEPLPREHGGPLRLVVPGWYAVASVKWLTRIELVRTPFEGYFQTDRYRYLAPGRDPEPVTRVRPRALVLDVGGHLLEGDAEALPSPSAPLRLRAGPVEVRGIAWTGHGALAGVEVSADGGATWVDAEVEPEPAPHVRTAWRARIDVAGGDREIVARARDTAGSVQPLHSFWNELGYGNNEVQRLPIRAR